MNPIFLDHHSTTPVDPRVLEAMLPYLENDFGNAASQSHLFGMKAKAAVDRARGQVAAEIGADAGEIVFTSGATESINLALKGVFHASKNKGDHIVTVATEHKAVLDTCAELERLGARVTYLPVDSRGRIDLGNLRTAISDDTILVSIMAANNEIGTLAPLEKIGEMTRRASVLFFTDAAQAFGKIPIDVEAMGIDLLAISGHKIYAPKGVGALYVRGHDPKVRLMPQMHGGGHERDLRSGTLNVPGIVALGEAARIADDEREVEGPRIAALRDRLEMQLLALEATHRNGDPDDRLAGNASITFELVPSATLMRRARQVAVSSGSACTSANPAPSHVLQALGLSKEEADWTIRFGLGRFTTEEDVDQAAAAIVEAVTAIRADSPRWEVRQANG
ncbi:MAG: aminotransferase class V-fold PLP-dependent enzyme [Planctomycetota bacterium]